MKDKKISEDSGRLTEKAGQEAKIFKSLPPHRFAIFRLDYYFLLPSPIFFSQLKHSYIQEAVSDSMFFNIAASVDEQAPAVANSRVLAGHIQTIPLSAEKIYEASGEEILGEEVAGEVTLQIMNTRLDQALVATTRL